MADFWVVVDKIGFPLALLLFGLLALYFDVVVSGRRYREVRRQRDQILRLALGGIRTGERSALVAKRALDVMVAAQQDGDGEDIGDAALE